MVAKKPMRQPPKPTKPTLKPMKPATPIAGKKPFGRKRATTPSIYGRKAR